MNKSKIGMLRTVKHLITLLSQIRSVTNVYKNSDYYKVEYFSLTATQTEIYSSNDCYERKIWCLVRAGGAFEDALSNADALLKPFAVKGTQ